MSRILITDGQERAALALARSLGSRGHTVVVCSPTGRSLAGASRHAEAEDPVSGWDEGRDAYQRDILDLVRRRRIDILIPVSEGSLRWILPLRDALGGVLLPFPDLETFSAVSDKARLTETARGLGIPVPRQRIVQNAAGLEKGEAGLHDLPFPVAIKPSRSFVPTSGGAGMAVTYASDESELARAARAFPPVAFPLLIQERVVGPGVGVFLLLWDGELRAIFSHRRIREKPPSGGVSVCREGIPADPALVEMARTLLSHERWQGVAMVEFKLDERSDIPYLMEVNGRFWGSLQLALDCGVDFPSLLVEAARGHPSPGPVGPTKHLRSRWEWGEVDHILARRKDGSGARAFADALRWSARDRCEVFRWSDRGPFLHESRRWFAHVLRPRAAPGDAPIAGEMLVREKR